VEMPGNNGPEYRFEWDPAKARANRDKHRVTFDEAITVFGDPFAVIFDDPAHSRDEPRYYIIGWSARNRVLAVWYTDRDATIRIISARLATHTERGGLENA
jgi:uncharacterized DUF497 family protein